MVSVYLEAFPSEDQVLVAPIITIVLPFTNRRRFVVEKRKYLEAFRFHSMDLSKPQLEKS